jgi:hypothetical protein
MPVTAKRTMLRSSTDAAGREAEARAEDFGRGGGMKKTLKG